MLQRKIANFLARPQPAEQSSPTKDRKATPRISSPETGRRIDACTIESLKTHNNIRGELRLPVAETEVQRQRAYIDLNMNVKIRE